MERVMNKLVAGICMIALMLTATTAFAGDGEGGYKEFRKERIAKMYEKLELSQEQKEQLEAHRKSQKEEYRAVFQELKSNKDALAEELEKKNIDKDKVQQIHAKIKVLNAKKEDMRLEGIMQVREILTDEQFSEFMKLKESRKEKFKKGSHHEGPMEE
ncbi:MAG: periplasmic heavy metal sensor [Candidatus Omnitrophica bacterium]|nr:periplasmic heavy metal sensor [Candidatus Omnitrophota bacterium]